MYTSKEFEDEVIEKALDKAFERLGYNQYSFSEELKDTYESEMTDYDNTNGFFDDLPVVVVEEWPWVVLSTTMS